MKIAIFTQPLQTNYGGLLQCYALLKVLRNLGHNPEVIRRVSIDLSKLWYYKLYVNVRYVLSWFKYFKFRQRITFKEREYIASNTTYFEEKYINPRSPYLVSHRGLVRYMKRKNFDVLIAGSDQCWRPCYSCYIPNFFFDFSDKLKKQPRKISYAASFGVDEWEFSKEETKVCAHLAQKFNAISVRESSGIDLCKKYLGVDAIQVLDPTMLLDRKDYEQLIECENEVPVSGSLFCYILDSTNAIESVINTIAQDSKKKVFWGMPQSRTELENVKSDIEKCVFPSVTQWLRSFQDAEMVITDSFHGCVFSIIFNKPFWVLSNKKRGSARFDSLLSMFNLQSRIIDCDNLGKFSWNIPIDWQEVNKIHREWKYKSFSYLSQVLDNKQNPHMGYD